MTLAFALLLWILCAVIAAGSLFAYMQGAFPSKEERRLNMGRAWLFGLTLGPVAAIISIFLSGFWEHGWRLK